MNSFSIAPYEHQPIIDTYKHWLVRDLYQNFYFDNLDDPNFLKKLSIIQAEGIRHDIALHAAVTNAGLKESSSIVAKKIQSAANLITASLDDGFSLMNQRMYEVNEALQTVNANIIEGNRLQARTNQEIQSLNKNMVIALSIINSNISQATNVLKCQLQQVSAVLQVILEELKIPESQRERRYHIEEGIKYFNMGMKTGDCLYFDDAFDEFNTAISIEKKDFFSWYYIGMIHLYSKNHVDIEKAKSSFEKYFHYAAALPVRHELFDEALLMKAECLYIEQNAEDAFKVVEGILGNSIKASLRGVKYLSAMKSSDKQMMAVNIFKGLVNKNPYIFMQILEDGDIISNDYIISFINEYCTTVKKDISEILRGYGRELEKLNTYPLSYCGGIHDEVNNLISQINRKIAKIGVVDAVALREELKANGLIEKIQVCGNEAQKKVAADEAQRRMIAAQKEAEEKRKRERAYLKSHGYVDLGLPSGTVWKNENERGFFENRSYGGMKNVPTGRQWRELLTKCNWSWSWLSGGFKVTGPNGASIFLPAPGHWLDLDDGKYTIYERGRSAEYLSCTMATIKDVDDEDTKALEILLIRDKKAQISHVDWYFGKSLVRLAY